MASNINILVLIMTFTCVVWCHMHEKSDMKHMNMSAGSNGTGGTHGTGETHGNGGTHGTGGTHGVWKWNSREVFKISCQISEMECSLARNSILDVWQGSEHVTELFTVDLVSPTLIWSWFHSTYVEEIILK